MSLSKKITLSIKDYSITLSSPLKFYKNDSLELVFSLNEYGIVVKNGISTMSLMPVTALKATLLIECDNGKDFIESTKIVENAITFKLDAKYSQFPGIGKMQIVLLDNDGCKITLPEFTYEIKESINADWDSNIPGLAIKVFATEDNRALTDENGNLIELVKISELTEATNIGDNDYTIVTQGQVAKKVKANLFKGQSIEWHSHSNKTELDKIVEGDKNKLNSAYLHSTSSHAPSNAQANVQADWNANNGDAFIKNKPTIPSKTSQLANDSGYLTSHQDISSKVDKVVGKSLIEDTEIARLAEVTNYDDTEIRASLVDITQRVTGIENSGGGATSSIEPLENDIPKVYFSGDTTGMNKDVENILSFTYKSKSKKINGYVKMKWQGTTSISFPKKNFTIKMFKEEECLNKDKYSFKNWNCLTNKYVLKANYIDHSHARNIVSARLWNDVVKSRTDYSDLPIEYSNMPNGGGVDGFPIKLYLNGVYQGLYTWNIGKEGWTYGMTADNTNYAVLCGEDYNSGCFRATAKIDETDWSLEYPDVLQDSIKMSWNNAITFVMNNSGDTFKNGLATYFDVNSLIDYYIFAYFSCGLDSLGKNQIYTTYDGIKWYAHMYDMDSTWGLYWNGLSFVSTEYRCQEDYEAGKNAGGNVLYMKLVENFGQEIYKRYQELRKSTLSIENAIDRFERFTDIISKALYDEDGTIYTGIPSLSTNNLQQIRNYLKARSQYVDLEIKSILTNEPVTSLTLSSNAKEVSLSGGNSNIKLTYSDYESKYHPTSGTGMEAYNGSFTKNVKVNVGDVITTKFSQNAQHSIYVINSSLSSAQLKAEVNSTSTTYTIENSVTEAYINLRVNSTNINYLVDIQINGISIYSKESISSENSFTLTATILPTNAKNKNVVWSVDNNVEIIQNGLNCNIIPKKIGTAIVTCISDDNSNGIISDSCTITIND